VKYFTDDSSKFVDKIKYENLYDEIHNYRIQQGRITKLFEKTYYRSVLISILSLKNGKYLTIFNLHAKQYPNEMLLQYFSQFIPGKDKPLISISSFLSYTKNEVYKTLTNKLKLVYPNQDIKLSYKDGSEAENYTTKVTITVL